MSRRNIVAGAILCALLAATVASLIVASPPVRSSSQPADRSSSTAGAAPIQWVVIGHSRQGRRIVAAGFGSGTHRLLIIGGVHGLEFGRAVADQLAVYLAAHPGAIPSGTRIDVLPCLNPDGSALRRRGNARNVDLNRNLPTADWQRVLAAGDPASLHCNGGSGPGSEPETRALIRYLRRGFNCVISLHSRGGFVDFNGPHARAIASTMSRACGLPVRRIPYQASITGSLGEYVPAVYRKPVITVELLRPRLTRGLVRAMTDAARATVG
jgi:murein peptide amidase A